MRFAHVSAMWSNQVDRQKTYAGRDEDLHAKHSQPKAPGRDKSAALLCGGEFDSRRLSRFHGQPYDEIAAFQVSHKTVAKFCPAGNWLAVEDKFWFRIAPILYDKRRIH